MRLIVARASFLVPPLPIESPLVAAVAGTGTFRDLTVQ
jgi:hypothetical protein